MSYQATFLPGMRVLVVVENAVAPIGRRGVVTIEMHPEGNNCTVNGVALKGVVVRWDGESTDAALDVSNMGREFLIQPESLTIEP